MKLTLFEFEDLPWFPDVIRRSMTDFLRYLLNAINFYEPITGILKEGLDKSAKPCIIDLCSGAGGCLEKIQSNLKHQYNTDIPVLLTDKFPNIEAYQYLKKKTHGKIDFSSDPVDAMQVSTSLEGLRTICSGFHHFNPTQALKILKDAVEDRQPILIIDGGDKNLATILAIIFVQPIAFLLFTPFIRPFQNVGCLIKIK